MSEETGRIFELKLPIETKIAAGDSGIPGVAVETERGRLYLGYALAGSIAGLSAKTVKVVARWFTPRYGQRVLLADKITE